MTDRNVGERIAGNDRDGVAVFVLGMGARWETAVEDNRNKSRLLG